MFIIQEMNPSIHSDVGVHEPLIEILPIEKGVFVPNILVLRDWPMDRPNEHKVNFISFIFSIILLNLLIYNL
jgi:hypothetical protein